MPASRAPASPPKHPTPTILLIDDDPSVCEALSRVLRLEGWRVVTALSGEQALDKLEGAKPSLLITDLCMAQVSGWDILFHEKLQRPGLPIFVITALARSDVREADTFATEFFQKPVDPDALIAAVRQYIGDAHT
jgi:DNA-binding NtrC family response regulator